MLLLHMSVQRGIRKVSFLTVFALEVSALVVVLGSSLPHLSGRVLIFIFIIRIVRSVQIILTLVVVLVPIIHLLIS